MAKFVVNGKEYSVENNQKLLRFLNSVEDTGMCIHGDLHGGNVITESDNIHFITANTNINIDLNGYTWTITDDDFKVLKSGSQSLPRSKALR